MTKYRVMVVEDERIEREATVLALQMADLELEVVGSAENGTEALRLFRETLPDVVIMDVDLPGISGLEVIQEMQKLSADAQYIILSAYNIFSYAQKALKMGVHEYLLKPCRTEELIAAVASAVSTLEAVRDYGKNSQIYQEKLDSIRPVLESECIFAIASMRDDMPLRRMFDFLGVKAKSGFVFAVKPENGQRKVLINVKSSMETMGVVCIGDILNGLCVFIALSESIFGEKQIENLMRFLTLVLEHSHVKCNIGVGRCSESVDELHVSYEQALKALSHTGGTERHLMMYSDDLLQEERPVLDVQAAVKRICAQMALQDREGVAREVKECFSQMMVLDYPRDAVDSMAYTLYIRVLSAMQEETEEAFAGLLPEDIQNCADLCILCDKMISQFMKILEFSPGKVQGGSLAAQAVEYIIEHYNENINLNQIADHFGITPFYLSRLVKKHTGKTFTDYLTYYRILKAKEMIRQGELSIKEITYAAGFNSQNYFSKIFKKYTGDTPSEYRNRIASLTEKPEE